MTKKRMKQQPFPFPHPQPKRLNMRIDAETYRQLTELRSVLQCRSDSACVRLLIQAHHAGELDAILAMREAAKKVRTGT